MELKLNEGISETIELTNNILDTADTLATEVNGERERETIVPACYLYTS